MTPRKARMVSPAATGWVWLAALALFGCKGTDGPSLPPATGSGAPPIASIPNVATLAPKDEGASASGERAGTGSLEPRHEAALGPKATGILSQITVDEGDKVKKGQLLFRVDSSQAAIAVQQAKAALASAEVQLSSAKLDFDRAKSLFDRNAIAPAAFDQAKSRYDAAVSGVDQAKAALGMAQRQVADTAVYSPIDGVVTSRPMNVGETATLMPPSVVLVVQDVEALELRARLPESALKTVREGSTITARFPAVGEEREVTIKRITPTIDPRTRTIEIVADVKNADLSLKAGMLAEVTYGKGQVMHGNGDDKPAQPEEPDDGKRASAAKPDPSRKAQ